jgi:hypothetical protein
MTPAGARSLNLSAFMVGIVLVAIAVVEAWPW